MNPATLSAVSALPAPPSRSGIRGNHLANPAPSGSNAATDGTLRRERLFGEFIDQASKTYADGMIQERLDDPAKLVPMYATINKLRLFAKPATIYAAEAVLDGIVETYAAPPSGLKPHNSSDAARDILRDFADACRAELTDLR